MICIYYVLLVETNPFPNLLLFYRTMLFEYPTVLSRFCLIVVEVYITYYYWQSSVYGINFNQNESFSHNINLNVTCNDISFIYVTANRFAGGLKKELDLRSGSQHWHFLGFFNMPVQAPTRVWAADRVENTFWQNKRLYSLNILKLKNDRWSL